MTGRKGLGPRCEKPEPDEPMTLIVKVHIDLTRVLEAARVPATEMLAYRAGGVFGLAANELGRSLTKTHKTRG